MYELIVFYCYFYIFDNKQEETTFILQLFHYPQDTSSIFQDKIKLKHF